MMKKSEVENRVFCCLFCALLLLAAMAGAEGPNGRSPEKKTDAPKSVKVDPCSLLTSEDVHSVQGDTIQETKPSAHSGGGLLLSQCLFRTVTPSKSVSLEIATTSSTSPRTFWRKQFHSPKGEAPQKGLSSGGSEEKRSAERREEDEAARPRRIAGVGEEAFWVGGRVTGALYVLKGNTFLRISVGGVREEPARIEKSVALARAALKRI